METIKEVSLETLLISILNIVVVYIAAFTYKLHWKGVLTVMVLASVLTAGVTHIVLSKLNFVKEHNQTINEGIAVLGITLFSSIAVLTILTIRFDLPEAIGISILSGLLSVIVRHLLTM